MMVRAVTRHLPVVVGIILLLAGLVTTRAQAMTQIIGLPVGGEGNTVTGSSGISVNGTTAQALVGADHDAVGFAHNDGIRELAVGLADQRGVPADCNGDSDVDLEDWPYLYACLTGPGGSVGPECSCVDLDMDTDVDLVDATTLAAMFTGGAPRSHDSPGRSDLNVVVLSGGSGSVIVTPGSEVSYEVVVELGDAINEGLAFIGFDLDFDGGALEQANTPADPPMDNFVVPDGITNPEGYGGTLIGGDLVQVGGGQNVIMNGQVLCTVDDDCPDGSTCDDVPAPPWYCTPVAAFPVGTVITGVAQPGTPVVVVTGSLTAPIIAGAYYLNLTNLFVSVIRAGETGNPFWATEAASVGTIANLEVNVSSNVLYVDSAAGGAGDGSNWCDAFNYLQDALAIATPGTTIRVADGSYKPDQGGGQTPGDREATFQLLDGVTIEGGYAGCGAPDPDDRDIDLYETIVSGDLAGDDDPNPSSTCCSAGGGPGCDDGACQAIVCAEDASCCDTEWDERCGVIAWIMCCGVCGNRCENSHSVVTGSGTYATSILAGFTITGGNADGTSPPWENDRGAGMYNWYGSPTVTECTFRANSAYSGGSGMHNAGCASTITKCKFTGNMAGWGGGGMSNAGASNPSLSDCTFSGNRALMVGGGMCNNTQCSPTLTNCTFIDNSADHGAGMVNEYESHATVTNCAFRENQATITGGGIRIFYW